MAARAALRRRYWAALPARLRLLRAVTVLFAAVLALLLGLAALAASGTWNAVANRDAPRTTSAADLNLALNDMDAQVANRLLSSGDAGKGRLETPYQKAFVFYGDARRTIGHDLRDLAVAAQGDRADERTVESLTDNFAEYQERIGRALENDSRAGGRAAALDDYRTATDLLRATLLPEARTLVDSNDRAFDAEYDRARSTLFVQLAAVVNLGVLLLVALGVLQWYLARRFHRILNPGVLAATVCALFAVLLGTQALAASAVHLRVARHDAFDSVVALSRARAIAYDANADESRWLLDPDRRDQYGPSFLAKSQKLYGLSGATLSDYDAELSRTWQMYGTDHRDLEFTGEFWRELDNITFGGERAAAEKTVEAYAVYQRDDRRIRALVAAGKERQAVEFCMDWRPGTSNVHFAAWMAALDEVTDINRQHFASSVEAGRSEAAGVLPWACGLLLAAGALTLLGLRPRFAEFR
ncbi:MULTISPECIES: hypothetical protein [unclassified Streptomyces]|uniref:hypothetical protein n=1 Tax=unclassified Streptomyces TaxID=2593676 RepID=UPI002E801A17|nr:hypothetical protein [Streptomyces sp. NBC_00589]WTI37180.1 hypothetical protein OIC96_20260 [Streptomyces sp. NBC_00775]WUB29144.1 hypothetical protein OHA51_29475 [Streptomyces sp. NBC_00589]